MKKIILMSNFMEKYQNKFNTKYNTNVTFDGTIEVSQYEKNNYIFRIRLIVISNGKIDYENYKEFIVDPNKSDKSLVMDNYKFIDIINDIDKLLNNF